MRSEDDFDRHWRDNVQERLPESKLREARCFLSPVSDRLGAVGVRNVLDAGCGNGVHVSVLSEAVVLPEDAGRFAVDISMSALRAARGQAKASWNFVRADVSSLPFEDAFFDVVFSYGVLAYTDDPPKSFRELCRVTRQGGLVGVWLFPRKRGLVGGLFGFVRWLCKVTGPWGSRVIADCLVPFLGLLPTRSGLSLHNASWRQCREVMLVNIAPRQLVFYDRDELADWFEANAVEIVAEDPDRPLTIWGRKR